MSLLVSIAGLIAITWAIGVLVRPELGAPAARLLRSVTAWSLREPQRRRAALALGIAALAGVAIVAVMERTPSARPVNAVEHARLWADADSAVARFVLADLRATGGVRAALDEEELLIAELDASLDRLAAVRPPAELAPFHEALLPLYGDIREREADLAAWTRAGDAGRAAASRERLRLAFDEALTLADALKPRP